MFLFLETGDFARDHLDYTQRGIRFVEEPRSEPFGIVAVFEDLYDNRWDLIEPVTVKGKPRFAIALGTTGPLPRRVAIWCTEIERVFETAKRKSAPEWLEVMTWTALQPSSRMTCGEPEGEPRWVASLR